MDIFKAWKQKQCTAYSDCIESQRERHKNIFRYTKSSFFHCSLTASRVKGAGDHERTVKKNSIERARNNVYIRKALENERETAKRKWCRWRSDLFEWMATWSQYIKQKSYPFHSNLPSTFNHLSFVTFSLSIFKFRKIWQKKRLGTAVFWNLIWESNFFGLIFKKILKLITYWN